MTVSRKILIGDECLYLGRIRGKVTAITKGLTKYQITWDGGKVEHYSQKDFSKGLVELCSIEVAPAQSPELSKSHQLNVQGQLSFRSPAFTPSEEEAPPTDESCIGRHYWCDRLTLAVTVLTLHQWKRKPKDKILIKGARCQPWWNTAQGETFPDVIVLPLEDLVEIREFSCELPDSLGKNEGVVRVGSVYRYTSKKTDKSGTVNIYPKVEVDRCRDIDDHWFWGFSYNEKVEGKWRSRTAAIPKKKLSTVREALSSGSSYLELLRLIKG